MAEVLWLEQRCCVAVFDHIGSATTGHQRIKDRAHPTTPGNATPGNAVKDSCMLLVQVRVLGA
eukprot:3388236-Pyramimonas_sp.AAC.1